jgi:hypothetical protein
MHQPIDPDNRPEEVPEDFEGFTPDKHFLPDYHDCPDINELIVQGINVPIHKLPLKTVFTERPHDVLATTWYWLDDWGPYTKEQFDQDIPHAVADFCEQVNEQDRFVVFPISVEPGTQYGKAYHDWKGAGYPFDLRFVIVYDNGIEVPAKNEAGEERIFVKKGLKFHLTTLVATPEYLKECPDLKQD